MGALSLVQSDTQTQNDKKTRSPHFFSVENPRGNRLFLSIYGSAIERKL
jgi:predicted small integral membrane protein